MVSPVYLDHQSTHFKTNTFSHIWIATYQLLIIEKCMFQETYTKINLKWILTKQMQILKVNTIFVASVLLISWACLSLILWLSNKLRFWLTSLSKWFNLWIRKKGKWNIFMKLDTKIWESLKVYNKSSNPDIQNAIHF